MSTFTLTLEITPEAATLLDALCINLGLDRRELIERWIYQAHDRIPERQEVLDLILCALIDEASRFGDGPELPGLQVAMDVVERMSASQDDEEFEPGGPATGHA